MSEKKNLHDLGLGKSKKWFQDHSPQYKSKIFFLSEKYCSAKSKELSWLAVIVNLTQFSSHLGRETQLRNCLDVVDLYGFVIISSIAGGRASLLWVAVSPRQKALNYVRMKTSSRAGKQAPCKRSLLSALDWERTWLSCFQFLLIWLLCYHGIVN